MSKFKKWLKHTIEDVLDEDEEVIEVEEADENFRPVMEAHVQAELFHNPIDNTVYIKFSGFDNQEESAWYAEHLANLLPVLFYESKVMH